MINIEIGDVVKKKGCKNTGPEAWVTVIKKEESADWMFGSKHMIVKYTVMHPDGTVHSYTDAVLKKMRDVYA